MRIRTSFTAVIALGALALGTMVSPPAADAAPPSNLPPGETLTRDVTLTCTSDPDLSGITGPIVFGVTATATLPHWASKDTTVPFEASYRFRFPDGITTLAEEAQISTATISDLSVITETSGAITGGPFSATPSTFTIDLPSDGFTVSTTDTVDVTSSYRPGFLRLGDHITFTFTMPISDDTNFSIDVSCTSGGPELAVINEQPFTDVWTGHSFVDEITWLADSGITTGYPNGAFGPARTVTRQAMAAFVYRGAGSPLGDDPTCTTAPFPDVPTTNEFCGEIAWLLTQGITLGFADGGFNPTAGVSRQAAAAFLYRAAGSPDGEHPACTSAPFVDVPVTHPFCGEIQWLIDEGVTTGYPDHTFRPGYSVTRQAMAAFLERLYG